MKSRHHQSIKQKLANKHACYVLITCDNPNCEGHMQVEMSYEGDTALASYLIQNAQSIIDEQVEEDELKVERLSS